jgi:hypothetical protein
VNKPTYQKLPGRGMTWGGRSRVWLGPDHVLVVLTRGYVEVYRRFFLTDIQAFVMHPTQAGKIWNAVWGTFAALFVFPALALNDVARIVMLCCGAPFLVALLFNVIRGPTCAFHVRTAVQAEGVPALSRVRDAKEFIARLEPLIQSAQGELTEQAAFDLALLQGGQLRTSSNAPPVMAS